MGFLRKRKNSDREDPINRIDGEDLDAAEELSETDAEDAIDEEDDFSPVKHEKKAERDEFRAAADEHAAAAAENLAKETMGEDQLYSEEDPEPERDIEASEGPIEEDEEDDFSASDEENDESMQNGNGDSAPPLPKVKKHRFKKFAETNKKVFKGVGIGIGILAGICLCVYIYGCATVPQDTILRNVYIEDNDVSGLTRDEAIAKLQSASLLDDAKITLRCKSQTFEIKGADIGIAAKLEDTVDKAMRYGKTGNIFVDGFANTLQLFSKREIVPNADVNEEVLRQKLTEFGRQVYGERVEHSLEFGDGVVIATPGKTGFDTNTDTAYEEVKEALNNEQFTDIDVTLNEGPPEPLTVDRVDGFTYCDPVDAYYDVQGNDVMVIKEVPGRYINRDEVAQLVTQVYEGGPKVNIPYYVSNAAVTADQLQAKLFNATIASYSTSYGSSNSNRRANIAQAASKINGKVLAPGEVFSFNDTVGPRTVANGFYTAKEYVNGETVDGIGGGTCQVSSTLYNAVLYSDLAIVSRTNHMFPVGYCPNGQDATVADSGVDFKFMNSMDYPIKISAVTSGATITVSIIGTQRDDPRTVKIQNTSTAVGADTSVHSVRYVYNSAGELIRTDDLGNSYYLSH